MFFIFFLHGFSGFRIIFNWLTLGCKLMQKYFPNINNDAGGRLAQMVEGALWKFLPQREVVRTPPAPGFFHVELKYIPL